MSSGKGDYIKSTNRKWLIGYLLLNVVIFAYFSGLIGLTFKDFNELLSKLKSPDGFLPLLGLPLSIVLEGFLSNSFKEVLVFWRVKDRLPGCRAFSHIACNDHRINMNKLNSLFPDGLPEDPREQNQEWYSLYKKYQDERTVFQSHKVFLLTRDLTALTGVLIPISLIAHWIWGTQTKMIIYHLAVLLLLFFFISLSAQNYGKRFVANVLAEATS